MLISSGVLVIGEVSYVEEKNKNGSGTKTLEYYTFLEKSLLCTLNIPLLFLVLHYGLMEHKRKRKVIEWVGVYSYPIYLYHILVKFISSFLMGEGTIGYYRKSGIYCFMRNDFPFERQGIHCKIYFWQC